MLALADVFVNQVHTLAPILAWVAVALVKLVLTAIACVARFTVAGVASDSIYTGAMVARVWLTVVDVTRAKCPFVTYKVTGIKVFRVSQSAAGFYA